MVCPQRMLFTNLPIEFPLFSGGVLLLIFALFLSVAARFFLL